MAASAPGTMANHSSAFMPVSDIRGASATWRDIVPSW